MALVHHLRVSKDPDNKEVTNKSYEEHIFAFVYVREQKRENNEADKTVDVDSRGYQITIDAIKSIFEIIKVYQEEFPMNGEDVSDGAGLTPMLFVAALFKWYGFKAASIVVSGFKSLVEIENTLKSEDRVFQQGSLPKKAEVLNKLNDKLSKLTQSLTGLRSRVNYVAENARALRSSTSTIEEHIEAHMKYTSHDNFKNLLCLLDSSKFKMRDNDKFDMIGRAMQQYQIDIKSLKAHLTIDIGLVHYH